MIHDRVLRADPLTRQLETFHYDPASDSFVVQTQQDVSDIVERNQEIAKETSGRRHGEWSMVASIPMNIYWDLQRRGILDDEKEFKR